MASEGITMTTISVSGQQKLVNFTSLNLNERMLDVNTFSFTWMPGNVEANFTDITAFKNKNLSQLVTISFLDENANKNHGFRGFITQINSSITDDEHTSFQITGSGVFCTLTEKTDCKSFLDKPISYILDKVNPAGHTTTIKTNIANDESHDYVVQYNQTAFDFIKMLAIRYGFWMYYDGNELQFGDKPSATPIKLEAAKDLDNVSIYASTGKANANIFAYDITKGEVTSSTEIQAAPGGSELLKITDNASDTVYKNNGNGIYMQAPQDQKRLDRKNKLNQQGTTAGNVFVSAASNISTLSVGTAIAITDKKNPEGQNFIIIEISHTANNNHGYSNNFTAIPLEVAAPNYTNPHYYPRATTQPAIIVENDDEMGGGLDRIKVRFPWMKKDENTPWIQVLSPYAGQYKGFRWLPEIDEDVMIDFLDNNIERPIMVGAFRTEKGKSGMPHEQNRVKSIGSKDGRKLKIKDNDFLIVTDNHKDSYPINQIGLIRNDSDTYISHKSVESDGNISRLNLDGKKGTAMLNINSNSENILSILLDKNSKTITIKSKGNINIESDQAITLNSGNINIKASQKLVMEGKMGVEIKGLKIEAKADTTMDLKAAIATIKGDASVEVSGAMVQVKGSGPLVLKGMPIALN